MSAQHPFGDRTLSKEAAQRSARALKVLLSALAVCSFGLLWDATSRNVVGATSPTAASAAVQAAVPKASGSAFSYSYAYGNSAGYSFGSPARGGSPITSTRVS